MNRRSLPAFLLFGLAVIPVAAQTPSPNAFRVRPQAILFEAAAEGPTPAADAVFIGSVTVGPTDLEILVDAGTNNTQPPDWLLVRPRRAATPARIRLEITRTDLPAGVYRARLLPRLRAGSATVALPEVNIQYRLARRDPELFVAPRSARLIGREGGFASEQQFLVANRGSGRINCTAVTAQSSAPWLRVRVETAPCRVVATASPATLAAGPYRGQVSIQSAIGSTTVPIAFQVFAAEPRLFVFPVGLQFEARQGHASPQVRNLSIANFGEAALGYRVSIAQAAEGAWIRLFNPQGTSQRGDVGTVGVGVDPSGLAAGSYHALLQILGAGARNSPMFASVVLNVTPADSQPTAAPSPSGLIFNVEAHSQTSAAQQVTIFTSSDAAVPFQASAQALDTERNWLAVVPASGTTSTSNPARLSVTVNPLGLNAGSFEGQLNTVVAVANGELEIRTVNVTMIVRPQGVSVEASVAKDAAVKRAVDCAPTVLSLTHTGLVSNFQTRAGWPTPLNVRLLDDCGQAVTDAGVVVSFSNGDPPLSLTHLRQGNYSGTWTPRSASDTPVGIRTDAIARGMTATFDLVGNVSALSSPVVAQDGVLNVFNRIPGAPLAPGMIIEIFGTGLAGGNLQPALVADRLPDDVNGVSVAIGGRRAPLYFLSPGQINAQVPYEIDAGDEHQLFVRSNRAYSVPATIAVAARQPGVAALADGTVLALDDTFQLIGEPNPARRGGYVVLYLTGLGATNPPVASGQAAPGVEPLARLAEAPVVTIGGRHIDVLFAGLTPGFVGLYQINVQLPTDLPPGKQDLVVTQGDVESNTVKLPVR